MTLENWNSLLYIALETTNVKFLTVMYFFLWIFVGNYVLLNLFLAVLLDGFSIDANDEDFLFPDELELTKEQKPALLPQDNNENLNLADDLTSSKD